MPEPEAALSIRDRPSCMNSLFRLYITPPYRQSEAASASRESGSPPFLLSFCLWVHAYRRILRASELREHDSDGKSTELMAEIDSEEVSKHDLEQIPEESSEEGSEKFPINALEQDSEDVSEQGSEEGSEPKYRSVPSDWESDWSYDHVYDNNFWVSISIKELMTTASS